MQARASSTSRYAGARRLPMLTNVSIDPDLPLADDAADIAPELQIQDPSESEIDASHEFPGSLSHPLGKIGFVESHDLSDVGDGVLWEPGTGRWKQDVAGSVEQPSVRRENDAKDGSQSASIESVGLDDEDGVAKTRLRSPRRIQVRPPHLATRNYHLLELTLRAWAALSAGSRPLGSWAKTSFSLDVTSSSRCLARYSETAVAYNSLLDTPCRFANSLADRNSSSGSEIAVFIPRSYQSAPLA